MAAAVPVSSQPAQAAANDMTHLLASDDLQFIRSSIAEYESGFGARPATVAAVSSPPAARDSEAAERKCATAAQEPATASSVPGTTNDSQNASSEAAQSAAAASTADPSANTSEAVNETADAPEAVTTLRLGQQLSAPNGFHAQSDDAVHAPAYAERSPSVSYVHETEDLAAEQDRANMEADPRTEEQSIPARAESNAPTTRQIFATRISQDATPAPAERLARSTSRTPPPAFRAPAPAPNGSGEAPVSGAPSVAPSSPGSFQWGFTGSQQRMTHESQEDEEDEIDELKEEEVEYEYGTMAQYSGSSMEEDGDGNGNTSTKMEGSRQVAQDLNAQTIVGGGVGDAASSSSTTPALRNLDGLQASSAPHEPKARRSRRAPRPELSHLFGPTISVQHADAYFDRKSPLTVCLACLEALRISKTAGNSPVASLLFNRRWDRQDAERLSKDQDFCRILLVAHHVQARARHVAKACPHRAKYTPEEREEAERIVKEFNTKRQRERAQRAAEGASAPQLSAAPASAVPPLGTSSTQSAATGPASESVGASTQSAQSTVAVTSTPALPADPLTTEAQARKTAGTVLKQSPDGLKCKGQRYACVNWDIIDETVAPGRYQSGSAGWQYRYNPPAHGCPAFAKLLSVDGGHRWTSNTNHSALCQAAMAYPDVAVLHWSEPAQNAAAIARYLRKKKACRASANQDRSAPSAATSANGTQHTSNNRPSSSDGGAPSEPTPYSRPLDGQASTSDTGNPASHPQLRPVSALVAPKPLSINGQSDKGKGKAKTKPRRRSSPSRSELALLLKQGDIFVNSERLEEAAAAYLGQSVSAIDKDKEFYRFRCSNFDAVATLQASQSSQDLTCPTIVEAEWRVASAFTTGWKISQCIYKHSKACRGITEQLQALSQIERGNHGQDWEDWEDTGRVDDDDMDIELQQALELSRRESQAMSSSHPNGNGHAAPVASTSATRIEDAFNPGDYSMDDDDAHDDTNEPPTFADGGDNLDLDLDLDQDMVEVEDPGLLFDAAGKKGCYASAQEFEAIAMRELERSKLEVVIREDTEGMNVQRTVFCQFGRGLPPRSTAITSTWCDAMVRAVKRHHTGEWMVGDFDLQHTRECDAVHASYKIAEITSGDVVSDPSATQSSASMAPARPAASSGAGAPPRSEAPESRGDSSDDEWRDDDLRVLSPAPKHSRKHPRPNASQSSAQMGRPHQIGSSALHVRPRPVNGRTASKPKPTLNLDANLHANLRKNPLFAPFFIPGDPKCERLKSALQVVSDQALVEALKTMPTDEVRKVVQPLALNMPVPPRSTPSLASASPPLQAPAQAPTTASLQTLGQAFTMATASTAFSAAASSLAASAPSVAPLPAERTVSGLEDPSSVRLASSSRASPNAAPTMNHAKSSPATKLPEQATEAASGKDEPPRPGRWIGHLFSDRATFVRAVERHSTTVVPSSRVVLADESSVKSSVVCRFSKDSDTAEVTCAYRVTAEPLPNTRNTLEVTEAYLHHSEDCQLESTKLESEKERQAQEKAQQEHQQTVDSVPIPQAPPVPSDPVGPPTSSTPQAVIPELPLVAQDQVAARDRQAEQLLEGVPEEEAASTGMEAASHVAPVQEQAMVPIRPKAPRRRNEHNFYVAARKSASRNPPVRLRSSPLSQSPEMMQTRASPAGPEKQADGAIKEGSSTHGTTPAEPDGRTAPPQSLPVMIVGKAPVDPTPPRRHMAAKGARKTAPQRSRPPADVSVSPFSTPAPSESQAAQGSAAVSPSSSQQQAEPAIASDMGAQAIEIARANLKALVPNNDTSRGVEPVPIFRAPRKQLAPKAARKTAPRQPSVRLRSTTASRSPEPAASQGSSAGPKGIPPNVLARLAPSTAPEASPSSSQDDSSMRSRTSSIASTSVSLSERKRRAPKAARDPEKPRKGKIFNSAAEFEEVVRAYSTFVHEGSYLVTDKYRKGGYAFACWKEGCPFYVYADHIRDPSDGSELQGVEVHKAKYKHDEECLSTEAPKSSPAKARHAALKRKARSVASSAAPTARSSSARFSESVSLPVKQEPSAKKRKLDKGKGREKRSTELEESTRAGMSAAVATYLAKTRKPSIAPGHVGPTQAEQAELNVEPANHGDTVTQAPGPDPLDQQMQDRATGDGQPHVRPPDQHDQQLQGDADYVQQAVEADIVTSQQHQQEPQQEQERQQEQQDFEGAGDYGQVEAEGESELPDLPLATPLLPSSRPASPEAKRLITKVSRSPELPAEAIDAPHENRPGRLGSAALPVHPDEPAALPDTATAQASNAPDAAAAHPRPASKGKQRRPRAPISRDELPSMAAFEEAVRAHSDSVNPGSRISFSTAKDGLRMRGACLRAGCAYSFNGVFSYGARAEPAVIVTTTTPKHSEGCLAYHRAIAEGSQEPVVDATQVGMVIDDWSDFVDMVKYHSESINPDCELKTSTSKNDLCRVYCPETDLRCKYSFSASFVIENLGEGKVEVKKAVPKHSIGCWNHHQRTLRDLPPLLPSTSGRRASATPSATSPDKGKRRHSSLSTAALPEEEQDETAPKKDTEYASIEELKAAFEEHTARVNPGSSLLVRQSAVSYSLTCRLAYTGCRYEAHAELHEPAEDGTQKAKLTYVVPFHHEMCERELVLSGKRELVLSGKRPPATDAGRSSRSRARASMSAAPSASTSGVPSADRPRKKGRLNRPSNQHIRFARESSSNSGASAPPAPGQDTSMSDAEEEGHAPRLSGSQKRTLSNQRVPSTDDEQSSTSSQTAAAVSRLLGASTQPASQPSQVQPALQPAPQAPSPPLSAPSRQLKDIQAQQLSGIVGMPRPVAAYLSARGYQTVGDLAEIGVLNEDWEDLLEWVFLQSSSSQPTLVAQAAENLPAEKVKEPDEIAQFLMDRRVNVVLAAERSARPRPEEDTRDNAHEEELNPWKIGETKEK